ncbi:MAG: ubiC [Gammaproteobacteria bacterium]|jgi:chorismate--pyruvate lyase|nr:ubiC [Gammaproteobacteria bacterium]
MPQIPPLLFPFITETGSMTACLKRLSKMLSVFVSYQGMQIIDDPAVLTYMEIPLGEPAWVRQVILSCDEIPVMFAESVMTEALYQANRDWLDALGEKPIGEHLFQNPVLVRSPITITQLVPTSRYHRLIPSSAGVSLIPLWARRSQLRDDKINLGLFEVFLPGFLERIIARDS